MRESSIGADVEVQVLGRIAATVDGRVVDLGGPRQQALLATLASRAGSTVANDVIIDAVWDGEAPDGASRTFRSYVARLRRAFDRAGADGSAVVRTASGGYRLDPEVDVDAALFEDELARARELLTAGEPAEAARVSGTALQRWRGPAYDHVGDSHWAAPSRARLEELRTSAVELRARALLDADRVADATALLEQHVATDPYREAAARLHALALYRANRDADALQVLRDFRQRLVEEHGLDPSDQLFALESMVLDRDPRLDRPVAGRRLRGYVLHEPIATSPLGTVHRAEQPSIGREVAVTVLPSDLADSPDVVRAFETRLQEVGSLAHPHLLPVYDYWREPGGAYVVTRLPEGTLQQAVEAGRVTAADALALGTQIAAALAAAHERGVAHGAIGPDAVVVDARGDAFLWGFPLRANGTAATTDVAALAALVDDIARLPIDDPTSPPPLPTQARAALTLAADPDSGRVGTAAGLAAALAAAYDGASTRPAVPITVGPNPYRGLAAFRETDADVFFGRDRLTRQILDQVRRHRVVAVVGPSGCGKSSLVRAGVLPSLRSDGAFVTTMVPAHDPLAEFRVALARVAATTPGDIAGEVAADPAALGQVVRRLLPLDGAELVLVIDQFEELFTLSEADARDRFLAAVAAVAADAATPVRIVLTLRADLLGEVLSHTVAGPLVRHRSVMVGPMGADELHEAVVRPAEVAGAAVDPALVSAVVADAARVPGSLPMVQFALTEVFAAAGDDGVMTLGAYRRIGGIEGVLGQRAEEVHANLDGAGRAAAHALFRRLVLASPDGPSTRRRALREELGHVPDHVVAAFGDARLLRFDRDDVSRAPTVEVAHEALFRAWPRLATWIEEEADDLRLLGHLTRAAAEWDASGRPDEELYRGARLEAALDFAATHDTELAPTERQFLHAGRRRRSSARAATRRSVRRLRALTAGLAVGLVLAMVAGGVALQQRSRAEAERTTAEARELAAAAMAVVDEDAELALLLALEAVGHHEGADGGPILEAERALHRAVTSSRLLLETPGIGGNVALHPDGSVFVTEGPEESGLVDVRDTATGASVLAFTGHEADINDVAFSSDGTQFATAGDDGLLRVWSTASGDLTMEQVGRGQVWGVTFSPDGRLVAGAWVEERTVRVLDLSNDGSPLEIRIATPGLGSILSFSPDGRRLAVANEEGVLFMDSETGEQLRRLEPATPFAEAVAWSPDGRWIASSSFDAVPQISDAETGELLASLTQHTTLVAALEWSGDSARLATGSDDGRARVFDVDADGAAERVVVAARHGPVWGVALSATGDRLLTGDEVATITRLWAVGLDGGAEVRNLPTSRGDRSVAAFTSDGDTVAITGDQEAALLFDTATGEVTTSLGERRPGAQAIEVSPDGELVATIGDGDAVHVWSRRTGEAAFTVRVPSLTPTSVAWSPDGELLAIAGDDRLLSGRVAIADRTGELISVLEDEETDRVTLGVTFSADGQQLYAARRIRSRGVPTFRGLRVWDWEQGEVLTDLPGVHTAIAASPTEQRIAAADSEVGVVVWDAPSGRRVATLSGHNGAITDVTYSADGEQIATAGQDGTVRVWNARTGDEQLVLEGHSGIVWSANFSPDGDRLVSTGDDGLARIWALDLDDLVDIAEARRTRTLTDDECRQYLHLSQCPTEPDLSA